MQKLTLQNKKLEMQMNAYKNRLQVNKMYLTNSMLKPILTRYIYITNNLYTIYFFKELSKITYKDDLSSYLSRHNLSDITEFKCPELDAQLTAINTTLANGKTDTGTYIFIIHCTGWMQCASLYIFIMLAECNEYIDSNAICWQTDVNAWTANFDNISLYSDKKKYIYIHR